MKFFWLVFIFCSSGFAWQLKVERTSHLGVKRIDVLEEHGNKFYFDGRSLGKTLPAPILKSWKAVAEGPLPDKKADCSAGTYVVTKTDKTKTKIHGCMQGDAYANYIGQLEEVRAYARKKKR